MKLSTFLMQYVPDYASVYVTTKDIVEQDEEFMLHGKYVGVGLGKTLTRHKTLDALKDELSNLPDYVLDDWLTRDIFQVDNFVDYLQAEQFFNSADFCVIKPRMLLIIKDGKTKHIPKSKPFITDEFNYKFLKNGELKLPTGYYVKDYRIEKEETK